MRPRQSRWSASNVRPAVLMIALAYATFGMPSFAAAELCWVYTDIENAKVPLSCVEQGDGTTPCSWNAFCNVDLDPSDCCKTVPAATPQTIGEMHVAWHDCFGNIGTSASPPPPGRGQRWYAFHRQFEADFNEYREGISLGKIESLEWCPNMVMPHGQGGAGLSSHPLGCGTGTNRPPNTTCLWCEPFTKCLYLNGSGPSACPAPASPVCSSAGVTFPYTSLDQFQSTEEIATLLDVYFHGAMHGAVAYADGGGWNMDAADPSCSPRDPMFWRLHKALDDVVRAWQDVSAVDVTVVIDRSGSMSASSGTGVGTRLSNAKEAADIFADLLEDGRADGADNRIGMVTFSGTASTVLPLTVADATLRNAGGPFETALNAITASGSTSIGAGTVAAVAQLCPGGTCENYIPAVGENERKAIILLTDGKENRAPCLEAGCQGASSTAIDYTTLSTTQLCAVGLGNAAAVNGDLLTLLAERQGGIYLNNTDQLGNDLKDFFVKCFAQLSDEFIGLDPKGSLGAYQAATPVMPFEADDEERLTFVGGWDVADLPGDRLQLVVTSPDGDLWRPQPAYGESSDEAKWAFRRARLPYEGQSAGTWHMQLVRPQRAFVNGFATDAFVDPSAGTTLVRREIHRLCPVAPDGAPTCDRVLYYEDGNAGVSVYQNALAAELGVSIGTITTAVDAVDLTNRLTESWDLIVYARQFGPDVREPYDVTLKKRLCKGQRAIVTDTRSKYGSTILRCAGAKPNKSQFNATTLCDAPNGTLLHDGCVQLADPGRPVFSQLFQLRGGKRPAFRSDEAIFTDASPPTAGIVGANLSGSDLHWFADVLVRGLSKLTPVAPLAKPKTGQPLNPQVRILPSFNRAGGYAGATVTVEVQRPTAGLGAMIQSRYKKSKTTSGDPLDAREVALQRQTVPTVTEQYTLNDAGVNGDLYAGNGYFSAVLPISAAVDGMYTYRFILDQPGPNAVHRELVQTLFVDVKVDPAMSDVQVGSGVPTSIPSQGGPSPAVRYDVTIRPRDALGNVWGPGRPPSPTCAPTACSCPPADVQDLADGRYVVPVTTPVGIPIASCTINAFETQFSLP